MNFKISEEAKFELVMRVYQEPGIMINSNCASEVPKKDVEQKKQEGKRAAVVRVAHGEATGTVCWGCGARNFL